MYRTDTERLKEKITEKNLTFQQVSEELDIDRSTLYRRLQNNRLLISDMQKLTSVLGLSGEEATQIFLAS